MTRIRAVAGTVIAASLAWPLQAQPAGPLRIAATAAPELGAWDAELARMLRAGDLRARQVRDDTLLPGRIHERMDQYFKGVRVFGGDVARQLEGSRTLSVFGVVYRDIDLDPTPKLKPEEAQAVIEKRAGAPLRPGATPELVVLPRDGGGYALAYREETFARGALRMCFVDARTGEVLLEYDDLQTEAAVGTGTGVLKDAKKVSANATGGTYAADDQLRPPALFTFDMRGNLDRTLDLLDGFLAFSPADLASDSDNVWTDGADVDAHVYQGWTYDYFYKRFGRRGLDGNDVRIVGLTHPVRREDIFSVPDEVIDIFYLNAFYCGVCGPDGKGTMVYGEGLPSNVRLRFGSTLVSVNYFAAALDVVAHELTHGVTSHTSRLISRDESGALNEAFSDIMGTSVEFLFQPPGDGPMKADYLMGEDIVSALVPGFNRSLRDPAAFGDPDHYSRRFVGSADRGGIHSNSLIASHAFYLAVEGGTNRTSGRSVQGVGAANRDQVEKAFYRGFALMLPSNATFSLARAATIQAARELYGASSDAARAVTQAWDAVGVN